jgi:hypothetical protein
MIPAVATSLDSIVGNVVALRHANGAGRAYELYLMTGIAKALADQGCTVRVQRSDGTLVGASDPDRRFVQRGGALTGIAGAAQGAANASSFVFSVGGSPRQWEMWNGIQFTGRSGGTHEIDLAIVPHEVGVHLRARPSGGCPGGRPRVSIECKDVQEKGSADEMRAFIARLYDLTILNWHWGKIAHLPLPLTCIYPGAPAGNGPFYSFWTGNRLTYNVLARRTGFRSGATAMSGYHGVQPRGPIVPGSAEDAALIAELTGWILANLH